jgi:hypothetical protein
MKNNYYINTVFYLAILFCSYFNEKSSLGMVYKTKYSISDGSFRYGKNRKCLYGKMLTIILFIFSFHFAVRSGIAVKLQLNDKQKI